MKITAIKAFPLGCMLQEPFSYSQRWFQGRGGFLIRVSTDEGIEGWGDVFCHDGWSAVVQIAENVLGPQILGMDPLQREVIWDTCYNWTRDFGQKGLTTAALSGIDIALWDIAGKAYGVPVYELLGGGFRKEVQAYATGLYRTERSVDDPAPLAEEAAMYVDQGFKAVKLKIGFGPKADLRNLHAVRNAVGDDIGLMVDGNHAYDAITAIKLGRAMEPYNLDWFEEPVVPENYNGYLQVRQALDIPIAGGEAEFTRFGFRELITRGCVDIAQPDLCITGGISETIKIAHLAQTFNIRCMPHVWGTGVALAAALHVLASLPQTPPSLEGREPMLEMDRTENPIRDQILTTPIEPVDGYAAVPQGPGLGIEVDMDAVERFLRR